jgi:hypothetical protein
MRNLSRLPIPLYAVLLPVLPVVKLFAHNYDRLSVMHAVLSAAAFLAIFFLAMVLLRAIFRRREITDLLLAAVFTAVFLPVAFLDPGAMAPRLLWSLGFAAIVVLILVVKESRRILPIFATIASAVLLAPLLLNIFSSALWRDRATVMQVAAGAFDEVPAPVSVPAEKPDIYYFIFDRYARGDQLRKVYGYDNSAFIAALRQRGFYVAGESYSNYQRTTHSVISSLNFDYLDRLDVPAAAGKHDWMPLYNMLQDFRIGRFLKGLGYEIHFSGTWWEPTRRIAIADVFHNFYEMPELVRVIYEYSLIVDAGRLMGLRQVDPLWWQCQRSRLMFESMGNGDRSGKPKFHFAHFLIPHPPFVTHESGRCMEMPEALSRTRAQNYVGQLKYANEQIIAAVDRILGLPGPKPIIILQADEGPWPEIYAGNEVAALGRDAGLVDWFDATPAELQEKMAILNAIYMPKVEASQFSPGMSPVNTFRLMLKSYFGMPIEPLPDRFLVFESSDNLYHFRDVTKTLKAN